MAAPNSNPATIFSKKFIFSTIDADTNQPVPESYSVSSPQGFGITPLNLPTGNKIIVPLTTSSSPGSPVLKFHFPVTGNTLYMTFAVKSAFMADGYYDYKTGIPATFKTALINWLNTNPVTGQQFSIPTSNALKSRRLQFSVYGTNTNRPQDATTFYINFKYNFGLVLQNQNATQ